MKNAWFKKHLKGAKSALPFSFMYDGQTSAKWLAEWPVKVADERLDANLTRRTLTWADTKSGLEVRCVAVDYTDFPAVEWTVYFKNTGTTNTLILEDIQGLDAQFEREAIADEFVLNGIKGDWCTFDSFEPYRRVLAPGSVTQLGPASGKSCDGPDGWPYFNLQTPDGGVIIAVGWPGQWASSFTRDAATGLTVRAGQRLTRLYLKPGEEIRTPLLALLFWQGADVVESQNLWRRWYRVHNLPRTEGKPQPPVTFFCGLGSEAEKPVVQSWLDAGIHLDGFWRDAGGDRASVWFVVNPDPLPFENPGMIWLNSGTWEPDPQMYPKGFKPFSDWARSRGMQFMLWFEPERVGDPNSWLGKNHPEWLLPNNWGGGILDEGNPAARQWLTEHISGMITSQGLDWYREDMNGGGPLWAWQTHDAPARQGMTENLYVQGHLAFWDELRRRHPHLRIDSCASGGRRNDLETMRRAVPLLRSDFQFANMPGLLEGNQGHTYGLASWLPFQGSGVFMPDAYAYRSFYLPSFVMGLGPENMAALQKAYGECRKIAPLMLDGDYYPLTPYSLAHDQWIAWQFNRPEEGDGVVQAFRRARCGNASLVCRLRGLDPDARYEVTNFDVPGTTLASGKDLMEKGLTVEIPDQAFKKRAPDNGLDIALPKECLAFGPFSREAGVPPPEALRRVPSELVLGKERMAGKRITFQMDVKEMERLFAASPANYDRPGMYRPAAGVADLKSLLPKYGDAAYIYLPFTAPKAGRVTFGFGADWEYEAYLDGVLISETLSCGGSVGLYPPSIWDHLATVDVQRGEHLLVVRFLRGMASALLAVGGGSRDLQDNRVTAPGSAVIVYRHVKP
jgi:alpha-galactosidase